MASATLLPSFRCPDRLDRILGTQGPTFLLLSLRKGSTHTASMEPLLPPSGCGPPNLPNSVSARFQASLPNLPDHRPRSSNAKPRRRKSKPNGLGLLRRSPQGERRWVSLCLRLNAPAQRPVGPTLSERPQVEALSALSPCPRIRKAHPALLLPASVQAWELWLGMGLPSSPQLCPGRGPQQLHRGSCLITVPLLSPATAHTETCHPRSWLNQLSQAVAQQRQWLHFRPGKHLPHWAPACQPRPSPRAQTQL